MAVFNLDAIIRLNTTDFENGLKTAQSKLSSVGNGIKNGLATIGKIGAVAFGAAEAAVGAFVKSSIDAGSRFDSSMAQVAATMGKSVDEIQNLRDFALDMGSKTAFSATEAADALNYMALAGYDAEKAMSMLPNVLNLAAAGSMDLASASDMVTDAQSALGLSMDETTELVDKMAMASSKSNTSVSQLGSAILTIGGTAKTLSGGTTELAQALGLLADNGIKGAEGGTALRNILLNLSPKSKEAAAAMAELGFNAYDADGKMRPLRDIFTELNARMEGMTEQKKTEILSSIFNKVDLKSVNALLATNVERWDELSNAIDNAEGASERMANTQLDNLAGDITLFKSALEGAQIAVSDKLMPSLREFVQFGTEGVSQISDAFKEGGLTGAMDAFGDVLSKGLEMILSKLPEFINAGMNLLGAVGQGILNNLPVLIKSAVSIVKELVQGITIAAPYILDGAMQIIVGLTNGISQLAPNLYPAVTTVILQLVNFLIDNMDTLVDAVITLEEGISNAILEAMPLIIDRAPELIIKFADALVANLPRLLLALATIQAKLMTTFLSAEAEIFGSVLNTLITYLLSFASEVDTGMGNMFNTFVEWLQKLPNQMAYWIGYAIGSFLKIAIELPAKLEEILEKTLRNIINFGTNFVSTGRKTAQDFFNSVINSIQNLPSRMSQLANDLLRAVQSLPNRFMRIGEDIVDGLWDGISSGWDWLYDKVSDLAQSLLEGAKDALDISSPSKKFEWIGHMVDDGLAKGIAENTSVAESAMDKLSDGLELNTDLSMGNAMSNSTNNSVKNNIIINIYGAAGQNVEELADVIEDRINQKRMSLEAVFA